MKTILEPFGLNVIVGVLLIFKVNNSIEAQIFGGHQIDISEAPYQVSATIKGEPNHGCGGVIINSEWVLTAGHAAIFQTAGIDKIHAGVNDWASTDGQIIGIDQIIIHPNFSLGIFANEIPSYDLALLHLESPLCFNSNVQPIDYATLDNTVPEDLFPGATTFISGWGDSGSGSSGHVLLGASIPIIDVAIANSLIWGINNQCTPNAAFPPLDESMIPLFELGIAAGQGDSGGPAVITKSDGSKILIGVSSWGGCPKPDFPSIYAVIREFSDFITDNVSVPATLHISSNKTFLTDKKIGSNIWIHSGAELVVNAKIQMAKNKHIIVEKGARLKIEANGILTNGVCDAPEWGGVIVLGNNAQVQPDHAGALTDPTQSGIVWIEGGQIDHAKLGVLCRSGGQVWSNNGKFFQNQKDVEFQPFTFSQNKSKFTYTRFIETGNAFPNTEGVVVRGTNGIEFNSCTFKHKDLEGIRAFDSAIKVINDAHFEDNETGISAYSTFPMSGDMVIGLGTEAENVFLNNTYHINASLLNGANNYTSGKFSLEVANNNFTGGDFGVIVDGASSFKIGGNQLTNVQYGSLLTNTGYNTMFPDNFIGCNNIKFGDIGIIAVGENRQMQFLKNDFQLNTGGGDFYLHDNSFPAIQGAIRQTQGSNLQQHEYPAANCFTDPGTEQDIVASGAPFIYYYKTIGVATTCDPEPLTSGNYSKILLGQTLLGVDCDQFGGLPPGLPNPTPEDLNARRVTLQQLAPYIGTSPSALDQYLQTLQEKDAILQYLLEQAIANQQNATAESLLAGEQSKAADWAIYGLRVGRGEYSAAASWLNQLPIQNNEDTQFRDIQLINLQRLQDPENFQLSETQGAFLASVAESTSPVRGYARGILGTMKDIRFYPDEIGTSERFSPAHKTASEGIAGIDVFPVPANDALSIHWPSMPDGSDAHLQIVDMFGKQYLDEPLGQKESQRTIFTGQMPVGVYYLVITNKGKPEYRAKFTINH